MKTEIKPIKKRKRIHEGYTMEVDGAKLTAARIAAGLSGAEVARRLGCPKSSVCKWETNKLVPSKERLFRMVEMYGTGDFVVRITEAKK